MWNILKTVPFCCPSVCEQEDSKSWDKFQESLVEYQVRVAFQQKTTD